MCRDCHHNFPDFVTQLKLHFQFETAENQGSDLLGAGLPPTPTRFTLLAHGSLDRVNGDEIAAGRIAATGQRPGGARVLQQVDDRGRARRPVLDVEVDERQTAAAETAQRAG